MDLMVQVRLSKAVGGEGHTGNQGLWVELEVASVHLGLCCSAAVLSFAQQNVCESHPLCSVYWEFASVLLL